MQDWLNEDQLQGVIWTDGELQANEFSIETAEVIKSGGPWGQAFPEPVFDGEFKIFEQRAIGQNQNHLKCLLSLKWRSIIRCHCV